MKKIKIGPISLKHFPELRDLLPEEVEEFFSHTGMSWSDEDLWYLLMWYKRIPLIELAYALSRTPVSVAEKFTNLRRLKQVFEVRLYQCRSCGVHVFSDAGSVSWCPACGFEGTLLPGSLYRLTLSALPEAAAHEQKKGQH